MGRSRGRGGRCCREPEENLGAAWGQQKGCQAAPRLAPASGLRRGKETFPHAGTRAVPAPWPPCGAGGTEGTLRRARGAGAALTRAPPAAPRSPSSAERQGSCSPCPRSAAPAALGLQLRLDNATACPQDAAGLRSGAAPGASRLCSAVAPCWCCGQMCLQGVQQRGQHPPGAPGRGNRVRGQGWRDRDSEGWGW